MSEEIKEIQEAYYIWEKEKQKMTTHRENAKEAKDLLMNLMGEKGLDEVIVSGYEEGLMKLLINYHDQKTLNKKELAESLGLKAKDLSNPHVIVELGRQGKLTTDLLEAYTKEEEVQQFSAKVYKKEEDEEE